MNDLNTGIPVGVELVVNQEPVNRYGIPVTYEGILQHYNLTAESPEAFVINSALDAYSESLDAIAEAAGLRRDVHTSRFNKVVRIHDYVDQENKKDLKCSLELMVASVALKSYRRGLKAGGTSNE